MLVQLNEGTHESPQEAVVEITCTIWQSWKSWKSGALPAAYSQSADYLTYEHNDVPLSPNTVFDHSGEPLRPRN